MALESAVKDTRSLSFVGRLVANSSGVRFPSELCGRSVLYSMRQASMMLRACAKLMNQCSLRHSSELLVETFDVRVLIRLARSDERQLDAVSIRPFVEH